MIIERIGEVVIPGLLIVFLALIILIFSVLLMGRILSNAPRKVAAAKSKLSHASSGKQDNTAGAAVVAAGQPSAPSAPGIPEQTVAAISAAIACVMESNAPGVPYTVRRIERAREARPVWGFAGMQQNTRPF